MAKDGGLLSPLGLPHPMPKLEGDKRDIHDQNPHEPHPHDRGPDTPPVVMYEGMERGTLIGHVEDVAADVLSTPMRGQRRATGEYESVKTENEEPGEKKHKEK